MWCWDGASQSGGTALPSQSHSAEYQTRWFCLGVAALLPDVIKINIIDCPCLSFKWCFVMLTLSRGDNAEVKILLVRFDR